MPIFNQQQTLHVSKSVPLGLYECPAPYHRLLTPAMLKWIASTGRFLWIKDTSRQNALITEKINVLKTVKDSPFRWYNGNVTTTLHSLKAGGDGYGGVSANFYPWVRVLYSMCCLLRNPTFYLGVIKKTQQKTWNEGTGAFECRQPIIREVSPAV